MAKNTIRDLDATAALNTDIGGVDIRGTAQASNIDDAIRYMAKILADLNKGNEPIEDRFSICDRSDSTKVMRFDVGSISTEETRVISVPDEDFTMVPDALSKSAGGTITAGLEVVGALQPHGGVRIANNTDLDMRKQDGTLRLLARMSTSDELQIGNTDTETFIYAGTTITLNAETWSTGDFNVVASGGMVSPGSSTAGDRGFKISLSPTANDTAVLSSHGTGRVMTINRMDGDGALLAFRVAGSTVGGISVSSGTVTYGSFLGTHYSENVDGVKDILLGTIVDSVDQFVEHNYSGALDRMPKFEISKTPHSQNVYGAIRGRYLDSDDDDKAPEKSAWWVQGVGVGHIRIAKGVLAQKGDAIVSAGDGTGMVLPKSTPMTVGVLASIVSHIVSSVPVMTHPDGTRVYVCTFRKG